MLRLRERYGDFELDLDLEGVRERYPEPVGDGVLASVLTLPSSSFRPRLFLFLRSEL